MMLDEQESDDNDFSIDLQKVSRTKSFSSLTRMLAFDFIYTPYFTVGDFYKNINDQDLLALASLCERDDDEAVSELLLIAEMLSRAEGITSSCAEEIGIKVGYLRVYTAGVKLARRGLIKAFYENMTFDNTSEYMEKTVFKPIEGLNPYDLLDDEE